MAQSVKNLPVLADYLGFEYTGQERPLRTWEKQALILHIQGERNSLIAKMVGRASGTVARFLRSKAAQFYIDDYIATKDQDLKVLQILAVDALRELVVNAGSESVRLNAALAILKSQGKDQKVSEKGEATAEDVAREIIHMQGGEVKKIERERRRLKRRSLSEEGAGD